LTQDAQSNPIRAMNEVANDIVWRDMTRAQLDAAMNNSAAVANSAQKIAAWTERTGRLRERQPALLDPRYGPRERNRIDIFRCGGGNAPLFVFIHGGYWQRNSKEIFGCMAEGPLAVGFDAAVVGYTARARGEAHRDRGRDPRGGPLARRLGRCLPSPLVLN
jgi:arylformamidase